MRPELVCQLLLWLGGLLWVALPGRAMATEPPAVRITSTPERLQLGQDTEAELRIDTEPWVTELHLQASRGELGPTVQEAPGRYRATYRAPSQRYPQVAIISAVGRGPSGMVHGWTTLPLWGLGMAEVRTRPGAKVSLRVGRQVFGPERADAQGVARVLVRVPPGEKYARFGARRIALGVPDLPLVQALADRLEVPGDSEQEVRVRLFTVTPAGRPRQAERLTLEATRGTVEAPEVEAPGVSLVRWRLAPGPEGEVELRGMRPGMSRPVFTVKVSVVPGKAEAVTAAEGSESPSPTQPIALRPDAVEEVRAGDVASRGLAVQSPDDFHAAATFRAGVVTDFGRFQAPSAGVQVEYRPWRTPRGVGLALSVDGLSFPGLGEGSLAGFEGRNTLLVLSAAPTMHLGLGRGVELWGSAGPALGWVRSRVTLGEGPALAETARVWGAQGAVGLGRAWGPGVPLVEARVLWFPDVSLHVLRGELLGAGLLVGYRLALF